MRKISQEEKLTVQFWAAMLLSALGIGLLYIGLFLPPRGQIDPTVLTAFGEVATFAGALVGVDYHYRYKRSSDGGHPPE